MAAQVEGSSLSHRSCPWQGHLIRFQLEQLAVQEPPERSEHLLVRPEVRAVYQRQCPMKGISINAAAPWTRAF